MYLLEAVIADQLQGEAVFVEELEGRSYDGAFIGRFVIAPCVTFKEFDLVIVEGRCRTISSLFPLAAGHSSKSGGPRY